MTQDPWDQFKTSIKKIKAKPGKVDLGPALAKLKANPIVPKIDAPKIKPTPIQPKMDRQTFRHFEPDRTLDLHGYTKDKAFAKLQQFTKRCYEHGNTRVLIITGKGKLMEQDPLKRTLRQEFPFWIQHESLKPYIVNYTHASDRHGGGGAFYMVLRRIG